MRPRRSCGLPAAAARASTNLYANSPTVCASNPGYRKSPSPSTTSNRPEAGLRALQYHPSGRYLLAHTEGRTCEIRDLHDGSVVPLPIASPVDAAGWSPDGEWLAVATDRDVCVFTFPDGRPVERWQHADRVTCAAFSGDGKLFAVGGEKTAQLRDLHRQSFTTPAMPVEARIRSLSLNHDGSRLALRCDDQKVRVVATADARPLLKPQPATAEGKDVPPLFVGKDRLAILDSGHTVRCWDTIDAKGIWERAWPRSLAMAASGDGKYLAVADGFQAVILDAASGNPVGKRIAHRNHVNDLSFHPDGTMLLSASSDQTIRASFVPSGGTGGLRRAAQRRRQPLCLVAQRRDVRHGPLEQSVRACLEARAMPGRRFQRARCHGEFIHQAERRRQAVSAERHGHPARSAQRAGA